MSASLKAPVRVRYASIVLVVGRMFLLSRHFENYAARECAFFGFHREVLCFVLTIRTICGKFKDILNIAYMTRSVKPDLDRRSQFEFSAASAVVWY